MNQVPSSYKGKGFVVSAAVFGDVTGGTVKPGSPNTHVPSMFDVVEESKDGKSSVTITGGNVFIGSSPDPLDVDGINAPKDGSVYLVVSWSTGFSAKLDTAPATGERSRSRKLYDFKKGKPIRDYRNAPVFVFYT